MGPTEPPLQDGYRWEVAISLLSEDEPYASRLQDELAAHVRGDIFLYSRKQEMVAQDGELVELFKRVFRSESRFAVVIHRAGWGNSRYTAVEQDALRARYLNEGPRRILIVSVDGTYPAAWYPEDHFRPSVDQFSVAQIAAIVVDRLQEVGGSIGPEDPVQKAQRLRAERLKRELLTTELGDIGPSAIEAEANDLFKRLEETAARITEQSGESMTFDQRDRACRLNYRWGSLVFRWHRQHTNSMDGAGLTMKILDAPTEFSGHRIADPQILLDLAFDLDHPEEGTWGWHPRSAGRSRPLRDFLSTHELANWAVNEFLEVTAGERPARPNPRRPRGSNWVNSWRP